MSEQSTRWDRFASRRTGLGWGLGLLSVLLTVGCGAGPETPADPPPASPGGRVLVLGLDGVDSVVVDELIQAGELPNFARLRSEGVLVPLQSAHPLLSPIIWTTIATGRLPQDHGITGFVTMDEGKESPVTSQLRRTKALWNLASEAGQSVSVVGWWATWPAETVDGTVVSDRTGLHFLLADEGTDLELPGLTFPGDLVEEIEPLLTLPGDLDEAELSSFIHRQKLRDGPVDFSDPESHLRWAVAAAHSNIDVGLHLWESRRPDLALIYVEEVDTISHLFGHLFGRDDLSGDLLLQDEVFGDAVLSAYRLADAAVGKMLDALDEDSTLVVLSDHGFRLGELVNDPSRAGSERGVSHKSHRLAGVLGLAGRAVRVGGNSENASILDITPSVLSLLGLPASDEMPGRVLDELIGPLSSPDRVASYENGDGGTATVVSASTVDEELVKKLRALGYLGSTESESRVGRNDAAIALSDLRYRDAAKAYKTLLEEDPTDPLLHTGLGVALVGLGREAAALESFEMALSLDPSLSSALYHRGAALERAGNLEAAIADYRLALRYDAESRGARSALDRLKVPVARVAETAEERQVALWLREVADAGRHGDYAKASELLAKCESLLPNSAVVFQYRANIAYLQGDRPAAIEAMRKALELDPENAMLQKNLDRLLRSEGEE
ncbi:MAG: alkaline phosphatase family protein [Thermoanaerobaculia bacterium]|nr:alkaline phosphatase family protein [Thermoanaerobaculia bacterium]